MSSKHSSGDQAVRLTSFGPPDRMELVPQEPTRPRPNEARVRHEAIGLNYLDVYQRQGDYPLSLPTGLGVAGAGVVEAVGSDVTDLRIGDRVVYAGVPPGSYAHTHTVPAERLVPIPSEIDAQTAAATLQQGITARFLIHDVYPVEPGNWVLFHAAAGGVGSIACQWAALKGARVIGTVGSDEKAVHAANHGCEYVINYSKEDVAKRVHEITGGEGVRVSFDSVGRATHEASIRSLGRRGMLVSFGSASGNPPAIDLHELSALGSLYATRPRFVHYVQKRSDLLAMASHYFDMVSKGAIRVQISKRYTLSQVAEAHRDMEARKHVGSIVMTP